MTTAKFCVPVGAPLHAKGNVALAPSHVYSTGSAPPSVTSELLRLNVPFEDVTASAVDMSTVESLDGGVGGSPGLVEQPAKSRETIMSIENIFAFIILAQLWLSGRGVCYLFRDQDPKLIELMNPMKFDRSHLSG